MRKPIVCLLLVLFIVTPLANVLAQGTNYRYTGQEVDPSSNLYYYGQRYYQPEVGRFTQPDPVSKYLNDPQKLNKATGQDLERLLENPQALNEYSYTTNNPVIYTDPFGLDSALIIYGENSRKDEQDAFKDLADKSAAQLKESDQNNKYNDGIFVIDGSSFEKWQEALKSHKDISHIEYWGHGYERGLSLGKDYLITSYESDMNGSNYYISQLYTGNTTANVEINLNTCNSGTSWYNGSSVAQQFSDHFMASVKGYIGIINYSTNNRQPFVRLWRKLLMPSTWKDGVEKWFYPRLIVPYYSQA